MTNTYRKYYLSGRPVHPPKITRAEIDRQQANWEAWRAEHPIKIGYTKTGKLVLGNVGLDLYSIGGPAAEHAYLARIGHERIVEPTLLDRAKDFIGKVIRTNSENR